MSIIGIDFGNESCYVATVKAGGIETLANDYSLRATPSFVAFDGKKRIIGVAAKNQQVTNMKNTINGFKRLLGRRFNDPHVQSELRNIPARMEQNAEGAIGAVVNYLGQDQFFTPEQLTAMLFTKLKETSATALGAQVNDCVITCPVYYTNAERIALLNAAQIAGLNVLRLMNETTSTALAYGFYKTDLPEDKPRHVVFVDCGHASLQVSICAFTKGKLRMVASAWDQVGGRDIDAALADHFVEEFKQRYRLDARNNPRAYLRLLTEVEKLKKQMSANSTKLPLNIECFMNDVDVSSSMQRPQMEELCAPMFQRVEATFKRLLAESKFPLEEIHSVEIVGGSTRVPAIKQLIEQVFCKPASTTLNQDESVSRGAALQCAIMSPLVRVREFGVTDMQNYAVKVSWDGSEPGEIEVFPAFHAAPFSRLLTLSRREPFSMTVSYAQPVPHPDQTIGRWTIKDVKPTERGEPQDVKVKVRINQHGIVLISSAALIEKCSEKEEAAAAAAAAGDQQAAADNGTANNGTEPMDTNPPPETTNEKKRKTVKQLELPLEAYTHGCSPSVLAEQIQRETKMIASDAKETQRVDARNGLEEFVYDTRNKLQESLSKYVSDEQRNTICADLDEVENWLYDEGENCEREIYVEKLNELRTRTDPIKNRANDYNNCPAAFEELKQCIGHARYAVAEFNKGAPKYEHLTETEFLNISETADKAQKWLDTHLQKFTQSSYTNDCPVQESAIKHENNTLNSCLYSVINRPKPKPAAKTAAAGKDGAAPADAAGAQNGANGGQQQQQAHAGKAESNNGATTQDAGGDMDVE